MALQYTADATVDISIQEVSVVLDVFSLTADATILIQEVSVVLDVFSLDIPDDQGVNVEYLFPSDSNKNAVIDPYLKSSSEILDLLPPRFIPTEFTIDTTQLAYSGYDYVKWNQTETIEYDPNGSFVENHPVNTHWFPTSVPTSGATVISSNNDQYTLPTVDGGVYNFTVDWGDSSSDTITSWNQSEITHTYATPGVYEISISGLFEGANFHRNEATGHMDCRKLIETSKWGSSFFIDIASYVIVHGQTSTNPSTLGTSQIIGGVWDGCVNWYDTSEVAPLFKKCGTAKTGFPEADGRKFSKFVKSFRGTNSLDSDLSHWTSPTSRFSGSLQDLESRRAPKVGVNFRRNWIFDPEGSNAYQAFLQTQRRKAFPSDAGVTYGSSFQNMHPSSTNFDVTNLNIPQFPYSLKNFAQASGEFDGDTSGLVTSFCTDLRNAFSKNPSFTGKGVQTWDTSGCTDIGGIFNDCSIFNVYVGHFKFPPNTAADNVFHGAKEFNQPCSDWGDEVKNITRVNRMFESASEFNNGDVTQNSLVPWTNAHWKLCKSFYQMFFNTKFNQDVSKWIMPNNVDVPDKFTAQDMFYGTPFNHPVDTYEQDGVKYWDMSNCKNISGMFLNCRSFNQPLNNWDTSNVTDMSRTFRYALNFDQDLSNWDTSNVTNMNGMFNSDNTDNEFNGNVTTWNTSNVTDMGAMFRSSHKFNQDIGSWDVGNVTNIFYMFYKNDNFNQNLNSWDTSKVVNMQGPFRQASSFNQPLNNWDTSSATNMRFFFFATPFNHPIPTDGNKWNTSKVTTMHMMFYGATSFNQDISSWDVSKVTDMRAMFSQASSFNQDLSSWDISGVVQVADHTGFIDSAETGFHADTNGDGEGDSQYSGIKGIFALSAMSKANLDATLTAWASASGTPSNLQLGKIPLNGTTETLDSTTTDAMSIKGMTAIYANDNSVY